MIKFSFFPQASKIVEWPAGQPGQLDTALLASLSDRVFLAEQSPLAHKPRPALAVGETIKQKATDVTLQLTNLYFCLLKMGKVLGRTVAVINQGGVIFGDVSIDWRNPRKNHKFRGWKFVRSPTYLPGKSLCLAATGAETFFHLLFDSLGRVWIAERAGYALKDFDYLIVQEDTPMLRRFLELLGGNKPCLVDLSKARNVRCENLFVGSYQSAPGHYHPDFLAWLRTRIKNRITRTSCNSEKTLFFSRANAGSRRLLNENEVVQSFPSGTIQRVCLEEYPLDGQLDLVLQARAVVAPHGGGLSHLAWVRPGLPVLEIFPPGFFNACYWELASAVGARYGCLEGEGAGSGALANRDFTISPDLVQDSFRFLSKA